MTQKPQQIGVRLNLTTSVSNLFKPMADLLGKYYSACLGKQVSRQQSWLITRANLFFCLAAFPADYTLLLRVAFALGFAYSVLACKRARI